MLYRLFAFVVLLFVCIANPGLSKAENRLALVIANGKYKHAPELFNPIKDGALLKSTLESQKFQVISITDADQREMKRAIVDFARQLKQGGSDTVALLYYAGHGVQVNGINYLVPVDAEIDDEAQVGIYSINTDEILKAIALSGSSLNIIILDACRDNPFRGFRSAAGGLAQMDAPTGTLIAFSTSPGKKALDGPKGKNSPYAAALAGHLARPGLTIEEIFKNVRKSVSAATKSYQWPWETTSLVGDFYPAGRELPQNFDAQRRIRILDPANGAELSGGFAKLRIGLGDSLDPINSIRIYVNERAIDQFFPETGNAFLSGEHTFEVPLATGRNALRVVASDNANSYAEAISLVNRGNGKLKSDEPSDHRGTLYILAIGVSKYPGLSDLCKPKPNCDLRFTGNDASAIADIVQEKLGPMYERVVRRVLINGDNGNGEPTSVNIIDSFSVLGDAMPNDTIIVYLAGHAIVEGGNYHFIPTNAGIQDGRIRGSSIVSWHVIQEAINSSRGRRILFFDTAHSSQVLGKGGDYGGTIAYSSSLPDQSTLESEKYRHGLFTQALIEALAGAADVNGDGYVDVEELSEYLRKRVPQLASDLGAIQNPQVIRRLGAGNFILAKVR